MIGTALWHHRARTTTVALAAAILSIGMTACGSAGGDAAPQTSSRTTAPEPEPTSTLTAAQIAKAPSSLTITCTDGATTVSSPVVATSSSGVALRVANTTGDERIVGFRVTPDDGARVQAGVLPITDGTAPQTFALPPGRFEVRCGSAANAGLDAEVAAQIVDRGGFYSSVDVEQVLGCTPTPLEEPKQYTARATRSEALKLMAPRLSSKPVRFVDGPGYRGGTTTQHLVLFGGQGYGIATVTLEDNLSYVPRIIARC